jgi:allantoinase
MIDKAGSGLRLHVANISSSAALKTLVSLPRQLTTETSVPYLYFQCERLEITGKFKANPPIRDQGNNDSLWGLVEEERVDAIGSFHMGVSSCRKERENFHCSPSGIATAGYLLSSTWT